MAHYTKQHGKRHKANINLLSKSLITELKAHRHVFAELNGVKKNIYNDINQLIKFINADLIKELSMNSRSRLQVWVVDAHSDSDKRAFESHCIMFVNASSSDISVLRSQSGSELVSLIEPGQRFSINPNHIHQIINNHREEPVWLLGVDNGWDMSQWAKMLN